MIFIEDFLKWWRDVGQFIPPCDTANQADRELFRQFAQSVSRETQTCLTELEQEIDKLNSASEEHDVKMRDLVRAHYDFKSDIGDILDAENISSVDKVGKIGALLNEKGQP